jgi:hypothetical protein
LAQKLGQLSALYSCIPTGMHGPTSIFWANITHYCHSSSSKLAAEAAKLNITIPGGLGPEAHGLATAADRIVVLGNSDTGAYWGLQTVKQLLQSFAGLLTQGVPGVPQDPLAPPSGPQAPSPDVLKCTENSLGTP